MTRTGSTVLASALITAAAVVPAMAQDGARRARAQRAESPAATVARAPATPQVDNRQHQLTCQNLLCNRYIVIGLSF
jgi:hypothetical protein